jgi:hypothetical protein
MKICKTIPELYIRSYIDHHPTTASTMIHHLVDHERSLQHNIIFFSLFMVIAYCTVGAFGLWSLTSSLFLSLVD